MLSKDRNSVCWHSGCFHAHMKIQPALGLIPTHKHKHSHSQVSASSVLELRDHLIPSISEFRQAIFHGGYASLPAHKHTQKHTHTQQNTPTGVNLMLHAAEPAPVCSHTPLLYHLSFHLSAVYCYRCTFLALGWSYYSHNLVCKCD